MAPTSIKKAKSNVANSTGLMSAGTCASSVLRWAFRHNSHRNETADPRVTIPLRQVKSWTEIWNRSKDTTRARIRKAWVQTLVKLKAAKSRWQCVKGPISAAIATLQDASWQPVDPTDWITPDSSGFSLSNNASSKKLACFTETQGHAVRQVLHRLEGDLESAVWTKASQAHNGQGLECGLPNFEPASRAHAKFVKAGDYKKAKAVELATNNKVWTKQRLLDAGIIEEAEAMCDRCGLHLETDHHRYYACCANDDIDHDDVRKTNYLAKDAARMPPPSLQMVPSNHARQHRVPTGRLGTRRRHRSLRQEIHRVVKRDRQGRN